MCIYSIINQVQATIDTLPTEAINEVVNSTTNDNLIGIGGIVATLVVGVITCFVTWILTVRTMKQLKIAFRLQVFSILSNTVTNNTKINMTDWQIKYKDKLLYNPCILTIDIINMGNTSLIKPPIKIRTNEDIIIIPAYFEEIPIGYENLWIMNQTNLSNCCTLLIDHINPKQIVKARFILDKLPKEKIYFECPMPDIQIQEISSNIDTKPKTTININFTQKLSIILVLTSFMLFFNGNNFYYLIDYVLEMNNLYRYLNPTEIISYIYGILILTFIMNVSRLRKMDNFLLMHPKKAIALQIIFAVLYLILLTLIIFNIIKGFYIQIIIAVFTIIIFSLFVYIFTLKR